MMRGGNAISLTANIGFLLLVLLGTIVVLDRGEDDDQPTDQPKIIATRPLPANHQLQPADLRAVAAGGEADDDKETARAEAAATAIAALAGRYLTAPVEAGKSVGKVAASPRLPISGGAIIIGLAVSRAEVAAGAINAGTETIACSGRKQTGTRSYVVEAVQCPVKGEDCVGFLRLPPAQRHEAALFDPGLAPRLSHVACDAPVPAPPDNPSR